MNRIVLYTALLFVMFVPRGESQRRRPVTSPSSVCADLVLDGQAWAGALAIDATDIYFVDKLDATLYRVSKDGGRQTALASFASSIVYDVAVDGADVYVASTPESFSTAPMPGTIAAVSKSGGTPRIVVSGVNNPFQLALDETHVYWVAAGTLSFTANGLQAQADGKIERAQKDGSARQTLAEHLSAPTNLVADTNAIYFTESGKAAANTSAGVHRVAKTAGAVTKIVDGHLASELSQTATEIVFWGRAKEGSTAGLFLAPKAGGAVRTLVSSDRIIAGPRVSGSMVYYVELTAALDHALMKISLAGGAPQVVRLSKGIEPDFDADSCAAYFGTLETRLEKEAH